MKRLILSLATVFLLVSCTQNDVALIKESTMAGYETTTVGKAFDASFDEPKWEAFTGEKGERVVQFTGKISQKLQDSVRGAFASIGIIVGETGGISQSFWQAGIPVTFQWTIAVNGKSFQLTYWESEAWKYALGVMGRDEILYCIYH